MWLLIGMISGSLATYAVMRRWFDNGWISSDWFEAQLLEERLAALDSIFEPAELQPIHPDNRCQFPPARLAANAERAISP
jgi:hypothetical protein